MPGCTASVDIPQYHKEMDAMSRFIDMAMVPHLRGLNVAEVPKPLRSRVIERGLPIFGENLHVLTLGTGTGSGSQWLFKSVASSIARGMDALRQLEKFSLKHDCTPEILAALARRCRQTLKSLDIESSRAICDVDGTCLTSIAALEALEAG